MPEEQEPAYRCTHCPVTFFVAPGSGLPASGPGMTFAPCRP
jgi:hypothetical protein